MKDIRIGNDIAVTIHVTNNGTAESFAGKELSLLLCTAYKKIPVTGYTVEGNVIKFVYYGTEQKHVGTYYFTLYEKQGEASQNVCDSCDCFRLVPRSTDIGNGVDCMNVITESVELVMNVDAQSTEGEAASDYSVLSNKPKINGVELNGNKTSEELGITGGGSVTVDDTLSDTSINPLQNKVIKAELDKKQPAGNYLTEHQDISGLATKEEIIDMETKTDAAKTYQPKGDYAPAKDYALKADIPSLDGYALKTEVPKNTTDLNNDSGYTTVNAVAALLANYVQKVAGKGLSTHDFTDELYIKLLALTNYDDTTLRNSVGALQTQLNTLVSGNASTAIESFNEIVSFLKNVSDSETLDGIIAGINTSIANVQNQIPNVPSWAMGANKPTYTAQEVGALPSGTVIPSKTSQLLNDSNYISSIPGEYVTETELNGKGYATETYVSQQIGDIAPVFLNFAPLLENNSVLTPESLQKIQDCINAGGIIYTYYNDSQRDLKVGVYTTLGDAITITFMGNLGIDGEIMETKYAIDTTTRIYSKVETPLLNASSVYDYIPTKPIKVTYQDGTTETIEVMINNRV